jgi:glycosyltransferase involved in cell wall biosynthesis
MKIEVYIMARNEERMIPYLIRHYSQFAKIILLEGNSSDRTVELATSLGATVMQYDTKDELSDQTHIDIKNECWKGSTANWIMVVDADEFIYHPDLINILSNIDATIIQPSFHNMFSDKFPTIKGQIYDEVRYGTEDGGIWKSKPIIFKPSQIVSMNWHPGSHFASPVGNVKYNYESGIKILHMRFLSKEYVLEHYNSQSYRMAEDNKKNGWGVQYFWDKQEMDKIFNETKLIKVV